MGTPFEDAMEEAKRQAGELDSAPAGSSGDSATEAPPETTQHEGMIASAVADFERWLRSHLGGGTAPSGITVHTEVAPTVPPTPVAPPVAPIEAPTGTAEGITVSHDTAPFEAPAEAPVEAPAEAPEAPAEEAPAETPISVTHE